jgi:hypothetical protein
LGGLAGDHTQKSQGFIADIGKLMNIIPRDENGIQRAQLEEIFVDLNFCPAVQDEDAVLVGVLIIRGIIAHGDVEISDNEIRCAILRADQDMFNHTPNLIRVDYTGFDPLPSVNVFCAVSGKAMNSGHKFAPQ